MSPARLSRPVWIDLGIMRELENRDSIGCLLEVASLDVDVSAIPR